MSPNTMRPRVIVCGGPFSGKTALAKRIRLEMPHLKVIEIDEFLDSKGVDKRAWRVQHPAHAQFRAASESFKTAMYGFGPLDGEEFDVYIRHDPPSQNGFNFGVSRKVLMLQCEPEVLAERASDYVSQTGDTSRLVAAIHWLQKTLIRGPTKDVIGVVNARTACQYIASYFAVQEGAPNA